MTAGRYLGWDYESHEVIEYERRGECNECGDCCRATITLRGKNGDITDHEGTWSEVTRDNFKDRFFLRMLWVEQLNEPCCQLRDNKCAIQDLKQSQQRICAEWPTHPSQVEPFPNCSYSFVEISWEPFGLDEKEESSKEIAEAV